MTETKMRICPWCGKADSVAVIRTELHFADMSIAESQFSESFHTECMRCDIKTKEYATKEEAEKAWNKRVF